jgi:DNA-binding transcriptional ArsR family regulator
MRRILSERTYRAIADPTRRAILDRLRQGPANANALAGNFVTSRPAISKHLRILRESGLVIDKPSGRERVYHLNAAPLGEVFGWLGDYRTFWQSSLNQLKRNLEEET